MSTRSIVPRATGEGGIGTTLLRWATAFINAITCTTINALTLAAAAVGFTIAGGTTSKTLTVTANTDLDEAVSMSSKLTIPGAWTTPTFAAGDFTASGSMTWTVEAGDVAVYAYTIMGKTMLIMFKIITSTIGGTPADELRIVIPASKIATKTTVSVCSINDAGWVLGIVDIDAGGAYIKIHSDTTFTANWTTGTNNKYVQGQITFEIN